MAKRVSINKEEERIDCEFCAGLCPEVFKYDAKTDKVYVIKPDGVDACIEEAILSCPAECIQWEKD